MDKLFGRNGNYCVDLSMINFDGFGISQKWIGYFEKKKLTSGPDGVRQSTDLVEKFFDMQDFFLLGAVTYHDDAVTDPEDEVFLEVYELAKKQGFFQPWSNDWEDYYDRWYRDDKDLKLPANFLRLYFNSENYLPFCQVIIAFYFRKIGSARCFLISPKLQIALYPHDDIGFGVIALNDDSTLGIEFLKFCEKDPLFRIHINPEILE